MKRLGKNTQIVTLLICFLLIGLFEIHDYHKRAQIDVSLDAKTNEYYNISTNTDGTLAVNGEDAYLVVRELNTSVYKIVITVADSSRSDVQADLCYDTGVGLNDAISDHVSLNIGENVCEISGEGIVNGFRVYFQNPESVMLNISSIVLIKTNMINALAIGIILVLMSIVVCINPFRLKDQHRSRINLFMVAYIIFSFMIDATAYRTGFVVFYAVFTVLIFAMMLLLAKVQQNEPEEN